MTEQVFCKELQMELREKGYSLSLTTVTKNNGLVKEGFTIEDEERGNQGQQEKLLPTFYFVDLYEMYCTGDGMNNVISYVLENMKKLPKVKLEELMNDIYIRPKLINYEKNKELLSTVPYIKLHDLAIIFIYDIDNMTVTINHKIVNHTLDELLRIASENQMGEVYFANILETLRELLVEEEMGMELPEEESMFILSNKSKVLGASMIINNKVLDLVLERLGEEEIYILPSSIHETIILRGSSFFLQNMDIEELREMVTQINETQVIEIEVLSNNVYTYNKKNRVLEIANK